MRIINSRADLDSLYGTPEYDEFIQYLKGTMTQTVDVAQYPDNYNDPDYDGPTIEPEWTQVENLTTIERYGFTKEELDNV